MDIVLHHEIGQVAGRMTAVIIEHAERVFGVGKTNVEIVAGDVFLTLYRVISQLPVFASQESGDEYFNDVAGEIRYEWDDLNAAGFQHKVTLGSKSGKTAWLVVQAQCVSRTGYGCLYDREGMTYNLFVTTLNVGSYTGALATVMTRE